MAFRLPQLEALASFICGHVLGAARGMVPSQPNRKLLGGVEAMCDVGERWRVRHTADKGHRLQEECRSHAQDSRAT